MFVVCTTKRLAYSISILYIILDPLHVRNGSINTYRWFHGYQITRTWSISNSDKIVCIHQYDSPWAKHHWYAINAAFKVYARHKAPSRSWPASILHTRCCFSCCVSFMIFHFDCIMCTFAYEALKINFNTMGNCTLQSSSYILVRQIHNCFFFRASSLFWIVSECYVMKILHLFISPFFSNALHEHIKQRDAILFSSAVIPAMDVICMYHNVAVTRSTSLKGSLAFCQL